MLTSVRRPVVSLIQLRRVHKRRAIEAKRGLLKDKALEEVGIARHAANSTADRARAANLWVNRRGEVKRRRGAVDIN